MAGSSDNDPLRWMPGWQIRELMVQKQISPVEVMQQTLDRIDRLEPKLHAFITVAHDSAMQGAREAEQTLMRGGTLGPLFGLPLSIKDQFYTAGIRTTGGS
jgi:Asp-tRNA(Asn)/Glu-tRNA(Gln) amidotransferase A subunit family amidase